MTREQMVWGDLEVLRTQSRTPHILHPRDLAALSTKHPAHEATYQPGYKLHHALVLTLIILAAAAYTISRT